MHGLQLWRGRGMPMPSGSWCAAIRSRCIGWPCGYWTIPPTPKTPPRTLFLRAWRGLPRFRSGSTFSTWLYRIVTNRCLNVLRSRRWTADTAVEEAAAPVDKGPEQIAEVRGELSALTAALGGLTPEQRAAFVLRHLEGCSHEEIAQALGISVPAVKSRLHRARVELLSAMDAWT